MNIKNLNNFHKNEKSEDGRSVALSVSAGWPGWSEGPWVLVIASCHFTSMCAFVLSTSYFAGEEKLHSHVLSIENVDRHKGGVYICTANNGVGQPASSQVVLHVLCKYLHNKLISAPIARHFNLFVN